MLCASIMISQRLQGTLPEHSTVVHSTEIKAEYRPNSMGVYIAINCERIDSLELYFYGYEKTHASHII